MEAGKKPPKVGDIMLRDFKTLTQDTPIRDAVKLLYEGGFSGTAVVDNEGNLTGVISEKDIFRVLFPGYYEFVNSEDIMPMDGEEFIKKLDIERVAQTKTVREVAKMPITTTPEASLIKIGAMMLLSHGILRLPVVEGGKLVGIVHRNAVYRAIFKYIFDLDEKKDHAPSA